MKNLTWTEINTKLLSVKTEWEALRMLKAEQKGRNNRTFALRIYSRYNHLRGKREREEIKSGKIKTTIR